MRISYSVTKMLLIATGLVSSPVIAQDGMGDPQRSGVLVSAVQWLPGTLLGTVATVVAVIAVVSVGFVMLTGRINGVTVILGCLILFGAASIVADGHDLAAGDFVLTDLAGCMT